MNIIGAGAIAAFLQSGPPIYHCHDLLTYLNYPFTFYSTLSSIPFIVIPAFCVEIFLYHVKFTNYSPDRAHNCFFHNAIDVSSLLIAGELHPARCDVQFEVLGGGGTQRGDVVETDLPDSRLHSVCRQGVSSLSLPAV